MSLAKRNKIPPLSVFYLLFISKFALVTVIKQRGEQMNLGSDFLLAVLVSIPVLLLAFVPLLFCAEKRKNPLEKRWISLLYSAYFLLFAGITAFRFSVFCSEVLNSYSKGIVFSVLLTAGALYCACLGIEGLSRFSGFAFVIFAFGLILLFSLNFAGAKLFNIFPVKFDERGVFDDVIYICSGFAELALLPVITEKVNGNAVKPFVIFIVSSLVTLLLLILLVLCVQGRAIAFSEYPVFTLFQTAEISGFERLDAVFTSLFAFGIFLRAALFVYCADSALGISKRGVSLALCGVMVLGVAFICRYAGFVCDASGVFLTALFVCFVIVIPLFTLIFGRERQGEKSSESL